MHGKRYKNAQAIKRDRGYRSVQEPHTIKSRSDRGIDCFVSKSCRVLQDPSALQSETVALDEAGEEVRAYP